MKKITIFLNTGVTETHKILDYKLTDVGLFINLSWGMKFYTFCSFISFELEKE